MMASLPVLRAFSKVGNYVGGAFDGGHLVGACVGFFAAPSEDSLHSHIAGVAPSSLGRSVGFALKVHQRSWAMLRGVSEIAWTFDPLVGRNAHFNLAKLAARPVEYLPNFYGTMLDSPSQRQTAHEMPAQTARRSTIVARMRVMAFGG